MGKNGQFYGQYVVTRIGIEEGRSHIAEAGRPTHRMFSYLRFDNIRHARDARCEMSAADVTRSCRPRLTAEVDGRLSNIGRASVGRASTSVGRGLRVALCKANDKVDFRCWLNIFCLDRMR